MKFLAIASSAQLGVYAKSKGIGGICNGIQAYPIFVEVFLQSVLSGIKGIASAETYIAKKTKLQ